MDNTRIRFGTCFQCNKTYIIDIMYESDLNFKCSYINDLRGKVMDIKVYKFMMSLHNLTKKYFVLCCDCHTCCEYNCNIMNLQQK